MKGWMRGFLVEAPLELTIKDVTRLLLRGRHSHRSVVT